MRIAPLPRGPPRTLSYPAPPVGPILKATCTLTWTREIALPSCPWTAAIVIAVAVVVAVAVLVVVAMKRELR